MCLVRHMRGTASELGLKDLVNVIHLQSTHFTHERSTSNIHRLVHSSISFFEKFSDSWKLGFYIRNANLVIRIFFCNIVIIIQTFRTGTGKLFF